MRFHCGHSSVEGEVDGLDDVRSRALLGFPRMLGWEVGRGDDEPEMTREVHDDGGEI
jgi:hypothetical protein